MENGKNKIHQIRFGRLVASLRSELRLKQKEMARRLVEQSPSDGISVENTLKKIQDIEQRGKANLHKDDLLSNLANSLNLTTLEKREFFFASSGFDEINFSHKDERSKRAVFEKLMTELRDVLAGINVPAFVTDSYCDVLLANNLVVNFLQIPQHLLDDAKNQDVIDGRNMMRVLFFSSDSVYRRLSGDDWEDRALLNIRFFRRTSLRFRGNRYFVELKNALDQYKDFKEYWDGTVMYMTDAYDEFKSYAIYDQLLPDGNSRFTYLGTEVFLGTTPYSELFMNLYLPMDLLSASIFDGIYKEVGGGCEEFWRYTPENKWRDIFISWPEEKNDNIPDKHFQKTPRKETAPKRQSSTSKTKKSMMRK